MTGSLLHDVLASSSKGSSGGLGSILIFLPVVVIMLFLLSRSSRKRRADAESMQSAVTPGAEVMTGGGLYGTVRAVEDDTVMIEIAPGVTVRYAIAAIARIITPDDPATEEPALPAVEGDQATDHSA